MVHQQAQESRGDRGQEAGERQAGSLSPVFYLRHIIAGLALLLLSIFISLQFLQLRTPRQLNLPVQQQVRSSNPLVGVHTRLTGIGDEAYIQRSFELVREMGASWVVELFPWAYVQPRSRYGYDWAGADMVINHAHRQGLTVVARLDLVPAWARPPRTTDRYIDPAHYEDYANYVAAFAERYAPLGVRHLIIWNEPNLRFEWGERPPDPGAYAALLKVVYPRVKAVAPDTIIIAGALSPGSSLEDGQARMDDMQYLASLYDAQAGPFFDMWAVHAYGGQLPPDDPPAPEKVNFRRIELVRELMDRSGDAGKPMIITEGGYNDHPRWVAAVRPADRIRWTIATYEQARSYPWLVAVGLWQFGTPFSTRSYSDNWNFVAPDLTPRSIYYAVRDYTQE
jgi:polysaccharide biosynthesis protein PslG